jgi:phosphopantetheinyl transferase (holo-ACP synthase)
MTVWIYGGYPNGTYALINTTYNQTNGTPIIYNWAGLSLGQYNWTIIANDGIRNSTNEFYYFNLINLTMNCEAGGGYQKDAIIPIGEDGAPIWPEGIVGSISHCDSLTGAIVAKSSVHISLGLDIEEIGSVTVDLWDLVFTENERKYLSVLTEKEMLVQSTAIFSIKEAFYKFQHPLTNTFLDFLDVEVSLPYFDNVVVLSNEISIESMIRKNRINYFFDNDCVISIITKN